MTTATQSSETRCTECKRDAAGWVTRWCLDCQADVDRMEDAWDRLIASGGRIDDEREPDCAD